MIVCLGRNHFLEYAENSILMRDKEEEKDYIFYPFDYIGSKADF